MKHMKFIINEKESTITLQYRDVPRFMNKLIRKLFKINLWLIGKKENRCFILSPGDELNIIFLGDKK